MTRQAFLLLSAVALGLPWSTLPAQEAQPHRHHESTSEYIKTLEDASRAEWQDPEGVMAKLRLMPGDEVADLGAGSGYFAIRFAHAVGATGKVYAIDTDPEMLKYLEERAKEEELDNIQTILAAPDDPKLGAASVDLIFICNVLHHISNRDKYYPLLIRALKPGGRLVNIDFHKHALPVGPPVEMKIAKKDVIKEVRPAGFRLVEEHDFLKYQYFLVFER